jgi:hypothetical protein
MKHAQIINKLFLLSLFAPTLYADTFSQIAEAQNVLDRTQMGWTNTPFATTMKISGYVKAEGIYDSRQDFTLRDGHFLLFPLDRRPDVRGKDINSRGDFGQYAIQTRLRFEAFGPDVGCMHSRSYIEGDFFGTTDDTIDAYRLRHAYLELESDEFNFLAGQTWHPMYIPVEAPDTISFNTGVPINPFSRNPQFRIVYHNDYLDILGAAMGFLNFRPDGPIGFSNTYFRDAIMPNLHLQARYKWDCARSFIGAGVDVMRICPRLVSNANYKEVNPFTAFSAIVYSRLSCNEHILLFSKFAYAQNATMWAMIGGYAVHSVDPLTDIRTYTPLRTISFWSELIFSGDIEPALFIGFAKNLGAKKTIIQSIGDEDTVYGIGTDIKTLFRASPRVRWYLESFVVGAEIEYTRAAYGFLDAFGDVINTHPIGNTRFLFATYYIF